MKVIINDLEDFIDELKFVSEEGDRPLVRCMIYVSPEPDGNSEFPVSLLASFLSDDGLICEMDVLCGKDINDRYMGGTDAAKELRETLNAACADIGVNVRPGRIDLE
jgi:hypothetical protein